MTHDARIRYKPNEKTAVLEAGLGLFVLVGKFPNASLARNFVATLPRVVRFLERQRRPFIAKVYCPSHATAESLGQRPGRVELWLSTEE